MKLTDKFKGSYLVDRMPEALWTGIHNTVQRAETKTIPNNNNKKKKCKKAKWLSEEALQKVEKGREVKIKEERERNTQSHAEFQRTARRDKKDFLSE